MSRGSNTQTTLLWSVIASSLMAEETVFDMLLGCSPNNQLSPPRCQWKDSIRIRSFLCPVPSQKRGRPDRARRKCKWHGKEWHGRLSPVSLVVHLQDGGKFRVRTLQTMSLSNEEQGNGVKNIGNKEYSPVPFSISMMVSSVSDESNC